MVATIDIVRALADPTRLRIAALLGHMELAVGELAAVLDQSQPRVSRHIRILAEARLVERHREGSWVFLRLPDSALIDALRAAADRWPYDSADRAVIAADRAALTRIQADRAAAAERYFAEHAAQWDAIRSLYVAEAEVEDAIVDTLSSRPLGHLLDIGTGTGRMAALLGARAERVTALDRSPDMLRFARSKLADADVPVALLQGDFRGLPLADGEVDTAILHQSLHYAHDAAAVVGEAARVLRPGGRLLIVDFAPHDREELRGEHAHARLGFADDQIAGWCAAAGLELARPRALAGGALTVKLWLASRADVPAGTDAGTHTDTDIPEPEGQPA